MTNYLCWDPDLGQTIDDGEKIGARNHSDAAETFARSRDKRGDYDYLRSGDVTVYVVEIDADGERVGSVFVVDIGAYAEPVYYACRLKEVKQ